MATTTGSLRDGTVNGLPQSAVNITLDGMNIQDNYAKSWDGMFTRVSPRLDAVEEVTVSTAAQGADMGSQGAAQVRFVTRSGTNRFQGSAYYYMRRERFNTNTWFNLYRNVDPVTGNPTAKARLYQDQPGARIGGPIWKDKAFFFVNYEWISSPGTNTANRTIMSPLSEQGKFQYAGGTVDLMALAAKNGHASTIDPVVAKLLADVRSTTGKGTVTTTIDPLTQTFAWAQPTESTTTYPTARLDYNITSNHRFTGSGTYNHLISDPDTGNGMQAIFPGFPVHGKQDSERFSWQLSLRSTLSSSMVNEVRYGATGGATLFYPDLAVPMYSNSAFGDMKGYALSWSNFKGISNPYPGSTPSSREGSTMVIEDTVNWLKGKHALTIGGSATRGDVWLKNQRLVPTATLGFATGDPADAMFTTANFPGASSTDITNARNLYMVLAGRVQSLTYDARVGEDGENYNLLGQSLQKGRLWQVGAFVQDSWRWKPNLTVNAGLRYEVQLPFRALNNSYSYADIDDVFGATGPGDLTVGSVVTGLGNLYKPGVFQGSPTMYTMLEKGTKAFDTDWNNVAPSIGAAWTTGAESGILHAILGAPGDAVIRGGYNVSYQRGGMSDFTEVYGDNPGILIDASRSTGNGNLGAVPLLFNGGSGNLGAPSFPATRVYPMMVPSASSNVRAFDPGITLPYAGTGTIGLNLAGALNYNEINIVENKFIDEFRVAQANLVANIAAGKGNTFAYTGVPGTSPLPIFLANLNGSSAAADSSKYTGTGWTNSTLVQSMYALNPNPQTAASNLRTTAAYRANMVAAGLPANFFAVNPDVNNSTVVTNGPSTKYNGIQLIFNRRYADGFSVQSSYTYSKGYQSDFFAFRKAYVEREQNYSNGAASLGNVRHNLAVNWMYDLPFGRGRKWGSGAGRVVNSLIGDWSIMGLVRWQSGRMVDYGNVRLFGMTKEDVAKMHQLRKSTDPNNAFRTLVWMLPEDVIDNTIKAYSISATGYTAGTPEGRYFAPANSPSCLETVAGYGDCGVQSVIVTGPQVFRTDITVGKRFAIAGPVMGEFQWMIFNLFNNTNFNPVGGTLASSYVGSVKDNYQVTTAVDQSRTMQLAFRILF
ncbi:MAG: TonB-dependent receptor [Vicinamibacterales bacterium]|nr:TonB-dependent receptor [Vicinamibacterales bacterium]